MRSTTLFEAEDHGIPPFSKFLRDYLMLLAKRREEDGRRG